MEVTDRMAVREEDVQGLVARICAMVSRCDPLELLVRCNKVAALDFYDFKDEQQREISRSAGLLRAGEYVQSILISADCAHSLNLCRRVEKPQPPFPPLVNEILEALDRTHDPHAIEAGKSLNKKSPQLKQLAEAVEAVVRHQAAGTNPSIDRRIIPQTCVEVKGVQ